MKIIKRSGEEVVFNGDKIVAAIEKANKEVGSRWRLSDEEITAIEKEVEEDCASMSRAANVEEIQDMVENGIMAKGRYEVARKYITYRYRRAMVRKSNTTDEQILSLIECSNEEVKQENSNKNPIVNSVQRDYMAGEVSKDLTRRFLLSPEIVKAQVRQADALHNALEVGIYRGRRQIAACFVGEDQAPRVFP